MTGSQVCAAHRGDLAPLERGRQARRRAHPKVRQNGQGRVPDGQGEGLHKGSRIGKVNEGSKVMNRDEDLSFQFLLLEDAREKKFDFHARVIQKSFQKYFNQQKYLREKEDAAGMVTRTSSRFKLTLVTRRFLNFSQTSSSNGRSAGRTPSTETSTPTTLVWTRSRSSRPSSARGRRSSSRRRSRDTTRSSRWGEEENMI